MTLIRTFKGNSIMTTYYKKINIPLRTFGLWWDMMCAGEVLLKSNFSCLQSNPSSVPLYSVPEEQLLLKKCSLTYFMTLKSFVNKICKTIKKKFHLLGCKREIGREEKRDSVLYEY